MANLLQTKSISTILGEASETGEHTLQRSLGAGSLVSRSASAPSSAPASSSSPVPAAARYAGPGVVYSFILAAIGCVFAGLCYAEFSAMIPCRGIRLHLWVRHTRRNFRLDHRLGSRTRVCLRCRHRLLRLVGLRSFARPGLRPAGFRQNSPARPGRPLYFGCQLANRHIGSSWAASPASYTRPA